MALRQLIITRKLNDLKKQLATADSETEELVTRRAAMQQREAEIAAALEEVTEETSEEDKAAVEAEASKWEEDDNALKTEEDTNTQRKADLQQQIDALNTELEELNARAKAKPVAPETIKRKDDVTMKTRFFGLPSEQRDALFAREDVKGFLSTVRAAHTEKRAITNVGLLIPDVLLPILRQVIGENSVMMKHLDVRSIPGTSRQNIMGDIPEAVWTETCGKLNELSLAFYNVELDGFKVGGYMVVCNPILEDADDVALATEILTAIGKAIGRALDKAVIFGTGTKMPLGIFTRLAQTVAPSDYPATARPWEDLHTKNVITIASSKHKLDLYEEIVKAAGKTRNKYATGGRFWVMNETTYTTLLVEAMIINAAGAIVSGQSMTMPVVGGVVEFMDDMPDGMIVAGYGSSYLLAERAGTQLMTSEHVKFIEDQTAFRGTARYDGKPIIPESFIAIGLGSAPSASGVTFAADTANA